MSDLLRIFVRLAASLRTRVLLMLARALTRAVSESGGVQSLQVQVLADELLEGIENPQHYGTASRGLPGNEIFIAFLAGDRSQGYVVADGDRRYRPRDLEPGEVILYTHEDTLAEGEEAPAWYTPPEEGPAQGLFRMRFKPGRELEIICQKLTLSVDGVPSEISSEGAAGGIFDTLAEIGRAKVVIPIGSSAGTYYVEQEA